MNFVVFLLVSCFITIVSCGIAVKHERMIRSLSSDDVNILDGIRTTEENAEEFSGQYQGDIIISKPQMKRYMGRSRNAMLDTTYRWPDAIVHYEIDEKDFDEDQKSKIKAAMKEIERVSCVKFVPFDHKKNRDHVKVVGSKKGCFSAVGRQGGEQILNLQPFAGPFGCFKKYTIVHEFLHTLGFFHMQSSTKRDEYLTVMWDNIKEGNKHNFDKYGVEIITNLEIDYDYGSVMHYSAKAFSNNGQDTLAPIKSIGNDHLGQRSKLSDKDIARLNKMYCTGFSHPLVEWSYSVMKDMVRKTFLG